MSLALWNSIELGQRREFHVQKKIRESEAVTTGNNAHPFNEKRDSWKSVLKDVSKKATENVLFSVFRNLSYVSSVDLCFPLNLKARKKKSLVFSGTILDWLQCNNSSSNPFSLWFVMCKPVQITSTEAFYFITLVHAGMGQLHLRILRFNTPPNHLPIALTWLPKPS